MAKELKHINRQLTEEEREQHAAIREGAKQDFPPKATTRPSPPPGIPSRICNTREQRGMTRYEVGQNANVPSTVVRAIERGDDVPLSQLKAVAAALGLSIELVEQASAHALPKRSHRRHTLPPLGELFLRQVVLTRDLVSHLVTHTGDVYADS